MKYPHIIVVCLLLVLSCKKEKHTMIEIETELGTIIAELYVDKAPKTCANFLKYIEQGAYKDARFYRTVRLDNQLQSEVKIEVIQGGIDSEDVMFEPVAHENTNETGVLHEDGTLSMARYEPGTATTEFFICLGNQPELDYGGKRNPDGQGFAAFGKVVQGMDIVKAIQQLKDEDQMLIEPVFFKIVSVKSTTGYRTL
ncbi:peptidylprolyl isomerase [Aestuariibaculum marinum]|uniref:Peptidyl-prolyl cis-trans isomerase n=1 Tax=Aestuariibaculum marinum TaxID=2683592 RepID=A0A8J6U2A0_9FLAO|nr:peptidylprolyl isomerase [Aestuariibaculum marinum]MBD0823015.1 peptidylprolyl isomerase [Aestuariibaculum marinum]